MEELEKGKIVQHLAGIVPIGGQPLDFKMPWHDSLMPIAPDYLAVERAVFQCALAGCNTIWIVAHRGTQPLVRSRVGDILVDPKTTYSTEPYAFKKIKEISVYYVPVHPKDRDHRDSLGWSALYGADSSFRVSRFISKWIAPEKFFVSFPYGIVPDVSILDNRSLLRTKQNVLFSYQNKTVKNNLHLPFTFDANDFFKCRDIVRHKLAEDWKDESAKYYDLAAVFSGLDSTMSARIELDWFHDISDWNSYTKYMASTESKLLFKPKTLFRGNKRYDKNT